MEGWWQCGDDGREEMARVMRPAYIMIRSSHHLPCNRERKDIVTPALRRSEVKFVVTIKVNLE